MIGPPSLLSMIMLIELRQAELEAQATRDRLGRQAQSKGSNREMGVGPSAFVVVVVLALVFAIGAVTSL